jgi:TonB family protein
MVTIMLIPSKMAIFIALVCASGMGQTNSPASEQPPAPAGAASTGQVSPDKPEEYALEPIEISKAVYPPAAKQQKVQGQVVGTILVSETGDVAGVYGFKGDPLLVAAAEEAAKRCKFKPVTKDGQPIPVFATDVFNFVLPDDLQDTKDVAAEVSPARRLPQRVRVSNGVSQRLVLRKVNPSYPEEARKAGIQGTVLLRAKISKEGKIADLQVTSGPDALIPAAMDAVRQWQYRPYLLMGWPVEVDTEIQVNFTLRSK